MVKSVEQFSGARVEDPREKARRDLVRAIGLNPDALPRNVSAAVEALAGEVLRLREDRTKLREALKNAANLADRDTLCPIFNRRAFEREVTREIALAERYGTPLCLVFIDLDRFKLINDRFGHATGDKVIQHVAETLVENVRQSDIVGRLGGDEFGIVLTHAELPDAQAKAKTLEAIISSLTVRDVEGNEAESVQLGASCGVVLWHPGRDAAGLIAEADETMFRRKNEKKRAR